MKVRDVMTREVVTVRTDDLVTRARRLLTEEKFHALPVVDSFGYLEGIVTCADFVSRIPHEDRLEVSQVMTRRVYTVPEEVDLALVAQFMGKRHVRHLVVVSQGRVRGILSSYDLLEAVGALAAGRTPGELAADSEQELRDLGLVFLDEVPPHHE